jgi:hypothetical protein
MRHSLPGSTRVQKRHSTSVYKACKVWRAWCLLQGYEDIKLMCDQHAWSGLLRRRPCEGVSCQIVADDSLLPLIQIDDKRL